MDIIDTFFIMREDGTSMWLPTSASSEMIAEALAHAIKHEIRKVAVASADCTLVHNG